MTNIYDITMTFQQLLKEERENILSKPTITPRDELLLEQLYSLDMQIDDILHSEQLLARLTHVLTLIDKKEVLHA